MTDLDPAIWENETLGKAANNERLDRLERQQIEDRAARLEDREPRQLVVENDYPGWQAETNPRTGTVPSNYQVVHFEDENPNDIPRSGNEVPDDFGAETQERDEPDSGPVVENDPYKEDSNSDRQPIADESEGGPVETNDENKDNISW